MQSSFRLSQPWLLLFPFTARGSNLKDCKGTDSGWGPRLSDTPVSILSPVLGTSAHLCLVFPELDPLWVF